LNKVHLLLLLFVPELLNKFKGRRLVVCHVLVPFLTELSELHSLRVLNVEKFFFLRDPHILLLPLLLSLAELIKFPFHIHRSRVIVVLAGDNSLLV
jgi:hypothetical protein